MKPLKLNTRLVKLVSILNDGQYHDGISLGHQLNMTRSAVWKAIKKLESHDVKIDVVKGKGYALLEPLILLNKRVIFKLLQNNKKIQIEIVEKISSTNEYLKLFFNNRTLRVCIAEEQVAGKGRLQRHWSSPFGKNIYLSLLYPFQCDVSELTGLSLVVSLAIIATCQVFALPHPILVKWPNDVIYQDKKLAGNLIELQAESYGSCAAIIGIGININMLPTDDHHIDQAWVSLREMTGAYIDRNLLVANLLNTLFVYLQRFEKHGLADFIKEWRQVDSLYGKKVNLKNVTDQISGIVQGIDEQGHLLIKLNDNTLRACSSGETQIIKK